MKITANTNELKLKKATLKKLRNAFREGCYKRDNHRCKVCSRADRPLDVHHIINRNQIANGGYVLSNGITLCDSCHERAELVLAGKILIVGYAPHELFERINSSEAQARKDAVQL